MSATAWNQENVTDVAESVGISFLKPEVRSALSRDVEYRLAQVIEEALKFMKHAKRTVLWSQDIAQALRVLDVEPLYGYDSTRPLRYGEASIGPGQPLFYVEDEEVDFEKLINAPLPKVPREISLTGLFDLCPKLTFSDMSQAIGLRWKACNHRYPKILPHSTPGISSSYRKDRTQTPTWLL
jgi:TATA box binding protein associated factor (TAF)